MKIINNSSPSEPFLIYMALFTKTYPRKLKKSVSRKRKERAKLRDHQTKVKNMDKSVAEIVSALKTSGHYNNTVILFLSDNGGRQVTTQGRRNNPNYPLRGSKGSLYEGGTKVPGFLHSPLFSSTGRR